MTNEGRLLVTGAGGMLGRAVLAAASDGADLVGTTRSELDVTDAAAVADVVRSTRPDAVVHLAGYTAVDRAEAEPDLAMKINRNGAANVATAAAGIGARVVYLSTDYVFDGRATAPYQPAAAGAPLSAYGRSKWQGEEAVRAHAPRHVIVRTSWVFAPWGTNFVRTIVRRARDGSPLRVVDDQTGCPTSAIDLAAAIIQLLAARDFVGTVHFCNQGEITWYGFARTILDRLARAGEPTPTLYPVSSALYGAPALRPAYSVLDTTSFTALTGLEPRPWQPALDETMATLE